MTLTFDGIVLPDLDGTLTFGAGPVQSGAAQTLGGYFDQQGNARRPLKLPAPLALRGVVPCIGTTWQAQIEAYYGLVGRVARLALDAPERWCRAALTQIENNLSTETFGYRVLSFTFERLSAWYGVQYSGDVPLQTIMPGPGGITPWAALRNYGQLPVNNILLTLAVTTPLTALRCTLWRNTPVERTGHEFEYLGTLPAGGTLVIDTGSWGVLNNGVDDFDNLRRTANHAQEDLLSLDPNGMLHILEFDATGGAGMTLDVQFTELWM